MTIKMIIIKKKYNIEENDNKKYNREEKELFHNIENLSIKNNTDNSYYPNNINQNKNIYLIDYLNNFLLNYKFLLLSLILIFFYYT